MRLGFKLCLLLLTLLSFTAEAKTAVQGVRIWSAMDSTRLVLDLSNETATQVFTLENPHRVVIDLADANLATPLDSTQWQTTPVTNIRQGQHQNKLRLVLDVNQAMKPTYFLLNPEPPFGHRLVIDLMHTVEKPKPIVKATAKKSFVVAIDPGHGGEDSGALGRVKGLKEKDVVLAVAKQLMKLVNAEKGMSAFLIRQGDYYVSLRDRIKMARERGADLFISIHADSFHDPKAKGASVFVLSEKGASSEAARWLAEKENRADLIGGVKLEDKGDLLAQVLLDLSQTASQSASQQLANQLIMQMSKITQMHHKTVQRAGFLVLKSPDIPSVLVELGFISNPQGEKDLASSQHQKALALSLLSGIKHYAAKSHSPPTQEGWQMSQLLRRKKPA